MLYSGHVISTKWGLFVLHPITTHWFKSLQALQKGVSLRLSLWVLYLLRSKHLSNVKSCSLHVVYIQREETFVQVRRPVTESNISQQHRMHLEKGTGWESELVKSRHLVLHQFSNISLCKLITAFNYRPVPQSFQSPSG